MRSLIAAIVLTTSLALSQTAFATGPEIHTSGLTEAQKAKLALQAAEMAEESKSVLPAAEKVKQYAEAGQCVAIALSSCAKEMGVAVNEFAETPVGRYTTYILAWKLVGKDLVRLICGIGFLVVTVPAWMVYFRRMCLVDSVEYDKESGKRTKINYTKCGPHDDACEYVWGRVLMFALLAVIWAAGLLVALL